MGSCGRCRRENPPGGGRKCIPVPRNHQQGYLKTTPKRRVVAQTLLWGCHSECCPLDREYKQTMRRRVLFSECVFVRQHPSLNGRRSFDCPRRSSVRRPARLRVSTDFRSLRRLRKSDESFPLAARLNDLPSRHNTRFEGTGQVRTVRLTLGHWHLPIVILPPSGLSCETPSPRVGSLPFGSRLSFRLLSPHSDEPP